MFYYKRKWIKKKMKFSGCMQVGDSCHEPNLVVATRLCNECLTNNYKCDICDTTVFQSNDEFCLWLFKTSNKNFIAIAQNMKSYDGYNEFHYKKFIANRQSP